MLAFKSFMIIIYEYSAVLEIIYIRLDCFKFKSFVSWICGPSQVLIALSYLCQVVLSHLISSESPLSAVKQKIPPRKTLRIFLISCSFAYNSQPSMFFHLIALLYSTMCIYSGNVVTWFLSFGSIDLLGVF